jgi:hypothetical protein
LDHDIFDNYVRFAAFLGSQFLLADDLRRALGSPLQELFQGEVVLLLLLFQKQHNHLQLAFCFEMLQVLLKTLLPFFPA